MIEKKEFNLIKVSFEIPASLAVIFGTQTSHWWVQRREIADGSLLGDFLTIYALNYPEFRKGIFDPVRRELSRDIDISLNGVLLEPARKIETKLKDGDRVTLVPTYSGGAAASN